METLANLVLRDTFRPRSNLPKFTSRPLADIRAALTNARRFVLDDRMSSFLADLSQVPFQCPPLRRPEVLDVMRHGARLPHKTTWIEFNGRAFRDRLLMISQEAKDVWGRQLAPSSDVPSRWGWLLEEHPQVDSAVHMMEFTELDLPDGSFDVMGLPFAWAWQTTDNPMPWNADANAGEFSHGIVGYRCPQIGVIYDHPLKETERIKVQHADKPDQDFWVHHMVVEMGGVVRYAMALLATLNDVPILSHDVVQSRGFVARGRYRKFLDHRVLRLNIPLARDTRKLAKKYVAIARRRAHQVRGHWRLYAKGEGPFCDPSVHLWGATDETGHASCSRCSARRTWIAEHQRGDASLGLVTHDFELTHET
jgi:hypothetical protein